MYLTDDPTSTSNEAHWLFISKKRRPYTHLNVDQRQLYDTAG